MQAPTFPPAAEDEYLSQGIQASQSGDSVTAISLFEKAVQSSSSPGIASFLLGSEWAAMGEMQKAEAALADAVLQAPGLPIARYQLGLLQFSSGKVSQAFLTWESLLQLPPEDPLPHFVRGHAALAQDHFEEAIAHFERGIAVNKTNEPLNHDIRKIVQRIQALGSMAPSPASDEATPEDEDAQTHVFLSSYQQQGKLH